MLTDKEREEIIDIEEIIKNLSFRYWDDAHVDSANIEIKWFVKRLVALHCKKLGYDRNR